MARFFFKLIICLLLAGAAGLLYLSMRSGDPLYTVYEWISPARFQQHDTLIRTVAAEHQVDPMLVKAVVWRESRFDAQKFGTAGERGLMQVSEKAAAEWAKETKVENFRVEELFDPKTNLEAGSWYLHRAIEHWQNQANPLPFALAVMLVNGELVPADFDKPNDPHFAQAIHKVQIEFREGFGSVVNEITVERTDGTTVSLKGGAEYFPKLNQQELLRHLEFFGRPKVGDAKVAELARQIATLDHTPDVTPLARCLS